MKLTLQGIVEAGMSVFADVGYERLSMRLVADKLEVHAGSLYYHVRSKSALLALMADKAAQDAFDAGTGALALLGPGAGAMEQVKAQMAAVRTSLLRQPGGARLLSAGPRTLGHGSLGLMERLLETLARNGMPPGEAVVLADVLLSYVTGYVLAEEAEWPAEPIHPEASGRLRKLFPYTAAAMELHDDEAMFSMGLALLCSRQDRP